MRGGERERGSDSPYVRKRKGDLGVLHVRSCDDNLGILELLVEYGVLGVLVGGGDESVTLVLKPFAKAKLVLCRT